MIGLLPGASRSHCCLRITMPPSTLPRPDPDAAYCPQPPAPCHPCHPVQHRCGTDPQRSGGVYNRSTATEDEWGSVATMMLAVAETVSSASNSRCTPKNMHTDPLPLALCELLCVWGAAPLGLGCRGAAPQTDILRHPTHREVHRALEAKTLAPHATYLDFPTFFASVHPIKKSRQLECRCTL